MPSVELGDMDDIINQYLPDFENNKSKFVRECILYYHKQKTVDNNKISRVTYFQMSIFFSLGVGLLCFIISPYYDLMFIASVCFLVAGIQLLIFSLLVGLKKIGHVSFLGG